MSRVSRFVVAAIGGLMLVAVTPTSAGAASDSGTSVVYAPPTDAPVVDGFRPPTTPYGPGNRGLDYATASGSVIVAAGDGTVTFAGQVGGTLHVTILHRDGIRTSYSFLADIGVAVGQRVSLGTPVGHSGSFFHVGARRGSAYLDPASLWGQAPPLEAHLVPWDGTGTDVPVADATALAQIARISPPMVRLAAVQAARPVPIGQRASLRQPSQL